MEKRIVNFERGIHIGLAGNIGAGKTTFVRISSGHYDWEAKYEDADERNPYLDDFYIDKSRWSFNLQIFFLSRRLRQIINIRKGCKTVIQDRTIYEDVMIFAYNLYKMGFMTQRDYENYCDLFELMTERIQPPDLLIYLRAKTDTLMNQIQKRGRKNELSIDRFYIDKLNERYNHWIGGYSGKLIIIDVEDGNFEDDKNYQKIIFAKIDNAILELESVISNLS